MPQLIEFDRPARRHRFAARRLRVGALLACRILAHEKGRSLLALAGVFIAILLVFVELGFFIAVPQGGMLVYDHMRFDLLLASSNYQYQAQPWMFPRSRLAEAAKIAGVGSVTPIYFAGGLWQDASGGVVLDVFLIGCDPKASPFADADIERQQERLAQTDTVLVDDQTRSIFGALTAGRQVAIDGRRMTIGGAYRLGTGFLGIGVVLMDEANFFRVTHRRDDPVNLGLIALAPGADPGKVEAALRQQLSSDVQLFNRRELTAHEDAYWTTRTSVGLIFGSGLFVSLIVGLMVLYQTLATQITRHLPEFATLKAIGYADANLSAVVILEAGMVVAVAFVPAALAAMAIYAVVRAQTLLPLSFSLTGVASVLAATLAMAAGSAFLSLNNLRRADPAEIF